MRFKIDTHDLQLHPETLSRFEQDFRNAFLPYASQVSGVTMHLTNRQDSDREFACRIQIHRRRSDVVIITDQDERLAVLIKRATRRGLAALRSRLGRKRAFRRRRRHIARPLAAV
jgi:hypothetical protein